MIIRKAGPLEFAEMGRIWLEASRLGHPFLGEAVLEEQLPTVRNLYFPQADNWVADEGRIIGFIGLLGAHVGGLFVSPVAHRRGVGRRLIEHAAARLGALTVEVYERNEAAVAFYLNCGFMPCGRRESDDEGRPFTLVQMARGAQAKSSSME